MAGSDDVYVEFLQWRADNTEADGLEAYRLFYVYETLHPQRVANDSTYVLLVAHRPAAQGHGPGAERPPLLADSVLRHTRVYAPDYDAMADPLWRPQLIGVLETY